jgi:tRNA pseudouridine38-40 synthase
MPRYRVILEYDGTPFVGWQVQAQGASVQGRLAAAVHRFSGEAVSPRGAGRTDAGVHALCQVAHFDLAREWPPETVRAAVNFHLKPDPIVVLTCDIVQESYDARFNALARHYRYRILARLARRRSTAAGVVVPQPLSAAAMGAAAQVLVGRHDFTTFRAAACQRDRPSRRWTGWQ